MTRRVHTLAGLYPDQCIRRRLTVHESPSRDNAVELMALYRALGYGAREVYIVRGDGTRRRIRRGRAG